MKAKKRYSFSMPKRDRLYPTKRETDQLRELKKQYGIRDEAVVKSRETPSEKKPQRRD